MTDQQTTLAPYSAMLHDLAAELPDLTELAQRYKMNRLQMAKWCEKPRHRAMIDDLIRFAERNTALVVTAARADAARTLRALARGEITHGKDVVRRACLDLLKLDTRPAPPRRTNDDAGDAYGPERPPTETEVQASIRRLARRAEEAERRALEEADEEDADESLDTSPAGAD